MSGAPAYVPDMAKRNTVNLLLLGAIGLPGTYLAGGYAYFFYPPGYVELTHPAIILSGLQYFLRMASRPLLEV